MSQDDRAMTDPTAEDAASEAAAMWCIRLSEGDLGAAEWADFDAWLAQPGHADLLQEAAGVWQATGAVGDWPQGIALRTQALADYGEANRRRWRTASPGWLTRRMAVAAGLLLALTVGFAWLAMRPAAYATHIGERQLAVLDDGSRMSLDAVTEVKVRMKDAARQVELLEGRAKFDVAKDPLRPFTVAAGDKLVVAVGTSFSVELIDGQVRVILYEGQVEVRDRGDRMAEGQAAPRRYVLKAGSQLVDTIGVVAPARISRPDLSQSLSWEQGLINFDREPLARAVERMNRYSTRQIRLADPALATIAIDGVYKAGDVDAFVEGIAALYPVRRTSADGAVLLKAK